jgi:hypothetical protein
MGFDLIFLRRFSVKSLNRCGAEFIQPRCNNIPTRKALAIVAALGIALLLGSGMSSVLANTSSNSPLPQFLQAWQSANPNYSGCLTGSVQLQTVEEVACQTNLPQGGSPLQPSANGANQQAVNPLYSYGPSTIDCSTHCWAGGVFYYNGPYAEFTGDLIIPYPPSSEPSQFAS